MPVEEAEDLADAVLAATGPPQIRQTLHS
jgi:hypothetical protein